MLEPLTLIRAVHFAGSVLAAGTVAFVVIVAEPAGPTGTAVGGLTRLRQCWNLTIWIALAVATLSGAAWLLWLAADLLGMSTADAVLRGAIWTVLTDTRFGQVWSARAALALLLAVLLPWPMTRMVQLAAAAAFLALPALIGHAGATPGIQGDIHLVSDAVHLLAAGAWLGGLPALALLLARANADPALGDVAARATARFSRLGMIAVGALLASGLVNSWNLVGSPDALVTTEYGRLLLFKLGLFVAMLAIAAVNKFRLTPRLAAAKTMRALARNSLAEIGLGVGVLAVVGALGTLPPAAHRHVPSAEIPPDAAFVHIHSLEAMADLTVDPGRIGRGRVSIHVSREDFSEFPARAVRLALDPPVPGSTIERMAVRAADGTWEIASLDLPQAGIWTARVIVTPPTGVPIVLDAPLLINP